MNIAINDLGVRLKPYMGGRANCQFCGGLLIAKCGDIYAWHWQHRKAFNCDDWKENETEWHRSWKACFDMDFQEVSIINNGEKHIADIRLPNGTIIEFQNSAISSSTIKVREDFYNTMIWVINASAFKGNLSLGSLVNQRLQYFEEQQRNEVSYYSRMHDSEIYETKKEVREKEAELNRNGAERLWKLIKTREEQLKNVKEIAASIFEMWMKGIDYVTESNFLSLEASLQEIKNDFDNSIKTVRLAKKTIENNNAMLQYISELRTVTINGVAHKITPFKRERYKDFRQYLAIEKASLNDIFIKSFPIKSEIEYLSYEKKTHTFDLATNPESHINRIVEKSRKLNEDIESNTINYENMLSAIESKLLEQIRYDIKELAIQLESESNAQFKLDTFIKNAKARIDYMYEQMSRDTELVRREQEDERDKARAEIMVKFKGQYTFTWKRERRSWEAATKTMYFDTGDGFLFKKVSDTRLIKIPYADFIKQIQE